MISFPTITLGCVYLGCMSHVCMSESPERAKSYRIDEDLGSIVSADGLHELKTKGLLVIDNVLTLDNLNKARDEVTVLFETKNKFTENDNKDSSTRKDLVMWVSESIGDAQMNTLGSGLLQAIRCIRAVPSELTSLEDCGSLSLGVPLSNQLACYDGNGAHYIPHRDTPEHKHPLRW